MDRAERDEAGSMNREVKATVFSDLFKIKKYLFQLYRTLHPEDTTTVEDDLTDVSINNVLVDDIYNDLGFMVSDRLVVLVEAQSTWTENVLIRGAMYLVQTWRNHFARTGADLYHAPRAALPRPEFYVLYTGERVARPEVLSLSEEFFCGEPFAIEVRARMLYGEGTGDVIGQYASFCRVLGGQVKLYGRTRRTIRETIRICKERDVLKEYLEDREAEVMDIMTMLFDQETATRNYVDRVRREAAERSLAEGLARGNAEGLAKGNAEGLAEGLARGNAEGLAKGLARGNVQGFVNACRDFGVPRSEALARVARRFNLTAEDARSEVERCWEAKEAASAE